MFVLTCARCHSFFLIVEYVSIRCFVNFLSRIAEPIIAHSVVNMTRSSTISARFGMLIPASIDRKATNVDVKPLATSVVITGTEFANLGSKDDKAFAATYLEATSAATIIKTKRSMPHFIMLVLNITPRNTKKRVLIIKVISVFILFTIDMSDFIGARILL